MRLGKVVGTTTPQEADEAELATMMVGRSVELVVTKAEAKPGPPVLELDDLTVEDERGLTVVDHFSLTVRAGEVVAVAGVQGNGQTELAEAITGLRSVAGGVIRLDGQDLTNASPRRALRAGIANVPEDRQVDGLVLSMSIADNLVLDVFDRSPTPTSAPATWPRCDETASESSRSSTSGRRRSMNPSALCPGATSKRSWSPASFQARYPAGGLPTDPGARRGFDRVRPPPDHRRARPGSGGPGRILGARRGAGPRGPDRSHLPGTARRGCPSHHLPGADRPHDGRSRGGCSISAVQAGRASRSRRPGRECSGTLLTTAEVSPGDAALPDPGAGRWTGARGVRHRLCRRPGGGAHFAGCQRATSPWSPFWPWWWASSSGPSS